VPGRRAAFVAGVAADAVSAENRLNTSSSPVAAYRGPSRPIAVHYYRWYRWKARGQYTVCWIRERRADPVLACVDAGAGFSIRVAILPMLLQAACRNRTRPRAIDVQREFAVRAPGGPPVWIVRSASANGSLA
jgi:hypothetical protein